MQAFNLNAENFSDMHAELEPQLSTLKITQKDILNAELLVEEIFWRMVNLGNVEQVKVHVVKKFFGKVQIKMTTEGTSYNPLVEVTDLGEDDEDYFSMMILKANRQKLHWLHKQNRNVVTINVKNETNRQLKLTLAGMVGGLIFGVFMKEFLSPETISLLSDNLITPINKMFLNALSMVIAPLIFFSIIGGIISMGTSAGVGRIGSKLTGLYVSTSAIAAFVGLIAAQIFFSGDVPQFGEISHVDNVNAYEFSWIRFIVDIIPSNLVSPIANGNLLQVIFLAVLFGMTLNNLGNKAQLLLNEFFLQIVNAIIFFVPLIVFLAMATLAVKMDTATVLMMGKLILALSIGCAAMIVVYMLLIRFVGKISPLPFVKKILSLMPIPFATSSSAVTMPFTMKFCTDKLGIAPKISSFSIPIGVTVNMNGGCIYLPIAVIMFLKMYGVDVDLNAITIIIAMTVSLSIAGPAVPNVDIRRAQRYCGTALLHWHFLRKNCYLLQRDGRRCFDDCVGADGKFVGRENLSQ